MGALVFVTDELSPFRPGEVGQVIKNMLKSMSDIDRKRSVLLLLDCAINEAEFSAIFPSVKLIQLDSNDEAGRFDGSEHHPPRFAYSNLDLDYYWKSTVAYRGLRKLAHAEKIDYVEFPSLGGVGFASVQEKRIRGFLQDACLAVRLHSMQAMQCVHEPRLVHIRDLNAIDLERKTLRDCDLIVGQLSSVAEATRKVFGFSVGEWSPRLTVHASAVLLDTRTPVNQACVATLSTPIILANTQRAEWSEVFGRGVNAFCNSYPEYYGDIFQWACSASSAHRESILRLDLEASSGRFHIDASGNGNLRETLIAKSVCVFPNEFESFGLAAYEASLLGALVVVNASNPAFGDDTPWQNGLNCIKFDGTALDLARALGRSFTLEKPLSAVSAPNDPWPWAAVDPVDRALPCGSSESPLVSVLIPHFNLGNYLPATLASVRGQTYPNVEIVIVDDYSTELSSRDAVEELRRETSERFRVITAPANLGPASARNLGITAVQGKYVLPLDADDLLDPRFIEIAVEALERNPEFSVVVTQAAYFKHGEPIRRHGEERDHNNYDIFIGESLVGGYLMNRFSTVTALFRTEVLRLNPYCDGLSCEDWDLYFRLVQRGYRFLVTTGVYFLYRDRAASRVKSARRDPKAYVTQGHSMLRTAVDVNRILPLTLLAHSAKLAQIYTSVSWRVTAPVRRAKSWLLRG